MTCISMSVTLLRMRRHVRVPTTIYWLAHILNTCVRSVRRGVIVESESRQRAGTLAKGGVEGPAGTANAVPLFLMVRRCRTRILVDRAVQFDCKISMWL